MESNNLLGLINGSSIEPFYITETEMLLLGDTFGILDSIKPASTDMIFAAPPYFLSNDGITCHAGKMVSVNKGKWDKVDSLEQKHEFNRNWIRKCKRVLHPNGSIWISGTLHNIYSIGMALEQEGFKIINNITWQKNNPPPNLACRCFTHSTETILWAQINDKKSKHLFNYELMKAENGGKQMKDVWTGPLTPQQEKTEGKHPTQKPLYILSRIIEASTEPQAIILDPFCGSSSTGVAAKRLGRLYIGIDNVAEYIELSKKGFYWRINMRDFEKCLASMRPSINSYGYYVDFEKMYANVNAIKVELNIMNSLIGSKNIEGDLISLIGSYPGILRCIPTLLAVRQSEIYAQDCDGAFNYCFDTMNVPVDQYIVFMKKTGLLDLIANHLINNLVDYALGIETGLDSNGRKNRGGHQMEDLVESFIANTCAEYYKEMYLTEIENRWGVNLSAISAEGTSTKRWDFVVNLPKTIFVVETNFYTGGGDPS